MQCPIHSVVLASYTNAARVFHITVVFIGQGTDLVLIIEPVDFKNYREMDKDSMEYSMIDIEKGKKRY